MPPIPMIFSCSSLSLPSQFLIFRVLLHPQLQGIFFLFLLLILAPPWIFIFYFLKVLQLYIATILYEIIAWERWDYNTHEYGLEMADLRKIKWIGTFWSYSASILHASSYIIRITGTTNKGWHPPWLLME